MIKYYLYNKNKQILKFLEDINKLDFSFVSPTREVRRNPDGPLVKNIFKKEFPIFTENERNREVFKNDSILFLGFMWNSTHTLFDMERLLLPLYFSFYLQKPVYIYLKPRYFKVDYLKGITKILDEKTIPNFTLTISKSGSLNCYNKLKNEKNIVIAPICTNIFNNAHLVLPNNYMFKCPDPFFCEKYKQVRKNDLNLILFLGTLIDEKGQYLFLQQVNTQLIKNYTLIFIGSERQHTFKQCIELAKKRDISLICVPYLHHNLLYHIIPLCKYQICYSYECKKGNTIIGDCNPRSITEGLFAGLPYIVSDLCHTPNIMKSDKLGFICKNNNKSELNYYLKKLLKIDNDKMFYHVEKTLDFNNYLKWLIEDLYKKRKIIY